MPGCSTVATPRSLSSFSNPARSRTCNVTTLAICTPTTVPLHVSTSASMPSFKYFDQLSSCNPATPRVSGMMRIGTIWGSSQATNK
jgi:hypothetical protein